MNQAICSFIKEQTCASFSCLDELGGPYPFSCFYAFDAEAALLIFKSSNDTFHASCMKNQSVIAGTILPDQLNKWMVQGIQWKGVVLEEADPLTQHAASCYYKKNPMAMAVPGEIWTIRIDWIKYTDTKLGFGKKLIWNRA